MRLQFWWSGGVWSHPIVAIGDLHSDQEWYYLLRFHLCVKYIYLRSCSKWFWTTFILWFWRHCYWGHITGMITCLLTGCFINAVCDYVVHSISFQTFVIQAFKIVVDSWKFSILLLYILWDDWPIFMISASNEQLQQELEYTLLKPDCHNWWISKMQSGHEDT